MKKILLLLLVICSVDGLLAQNQPASNGSNNRLEKSFPCNELFQLGSYYYPEQWPEEQWDRDLAQMAAIGITFTHFGEFAWQRMEPQEGLFDFAWLDKAVELAASHGLKVILCTPSPTPPAWLTKTHPEILIQRDNGITLQHGTRQHASWSNALFRKYLEQLVNKLGEHYGNNPAVVGWQLDNEPSHYGITDYGEDSQLAFRQWLQRKYGSIDRLNDTWFTAFWSETYDDFSQIRLPNPQELVVKANPHAMLDMNRFFADELADFINFQADILRHNISQDQWITTNLMPVTDPSDPDLLTHLDFNTYTRYMIVGANEGIGEQGFRMGIPQDIGIPNDLFRNSVGSCFGVMELQPGQVNWGRYNPQPLPGAISLWVWHVFGGGGKFVCNYRFRQPLKGSEQYHNAIMQPDGVTLAVGGHEYHQIAKTLKVLRKVADVKTKMPEELAARRTAILFSADNRYEMTFQPQTDQWNTMHHFTRYYNALTTMGAPIDIIGEGHPLEQYPFVVAPAFELLDSVLVSQWEQYVWGGGHLVLTCRTGQKDREAKIWEGPWAAPIHGLAGIDEIFFDHLPQNIFGNVEMDGQCFSWNNWGDVITPAIDTEVWGTYDDQFYAGKAAVIHRLLGKGSVTYIGIDTDNGSIENAVLRRLFATAGVEVENLPYGVIHQWRDGLHVILNYTSVTQPVSIPKGARVFLGSESLPPAGVAIYKL